MNNLNLKIINEGKQQLNEIAPFVWAAIAGFTALGGALGYNAITKSHYDQKMIKTDKGFFEPEMYVGEFFKLTTFNGDEDVWDLMNVPQLEKSTGWKCYNDDYGYYLKINGSSINTDSDLRVYLPKKEWFDQFKGKIRTIRDAANNKGGDSNTYGLCFYLREPKNAIKTKILRPDGTEFFGPPQNYFNPETGGYQDDPSRGWAVLETYRMSGYFSTKGDVLNDTTPVVQQNENYKLNEVFDSEMRTPEDFERIRRDNAKNAAAEYTRSLQEKMSNLINNPPSGLQEYHWSNYGEKYGRSEFDRWYDSSSGTFIVIGMQICAAIALAPLAEGLAGLAGTGAKYSATYWSVTIGGELLIGAWESYYLYNRGMTGQAALVLFCCFLPIFTEGAAFGKLIGRPPGYDEAVKDLVYKFYKGEFRSPSDFKNWMKSLDEGLRVELQTNMSIAAQYYSRIGTKTIQEQTIRAMKESLDLIKKSGIKGDADLINSSWGKMSKYYSGRATLQQLKLESKQIGVEVGKKQLLKSLGLNLLVVGGALMPVCVFAIGDNKEFIEDPQKILNGSENTVKSFLTMGEKPTKNLLSKTVKLSEKIKEANYNSEWDKAYLLSKEYFTLMKELDFISQNPNDWGKLKKYHKFIEYWKLETLAKLQHDYNVALNNAEIEKANSIIEQAKKIEDESKPVSQWDLAIINGTPSTYSKVQKGYTDENGKIYTMTNEELSNFIKWFCGYDIINKQNTPNSYQETNGVTVSAQYSYVNSLGKTETFAKTITKDWLVARLDQNVRNTKINFSDMTTNNYWGNIYYIRKIFMDYYDDYIVNKNLNTSDKQKN
jgi:hypothetical protein